jgi:hypothetical protein
MVTKLVHDPQTDHFWIYRFTGTANNSYTTGGSLYITPTLTEDEIGNAVYSGGTYRLDGCSSNNASACTARSGNGKVINPVQSARLTTQNSYNIQYVLEVL